MKMKFLLVNALSATLLFSGLQAHEECSECQECSAQECETSSSQWGYHLILDCKGCDIGAITDRDTLSNFTKTLVDAIDMKAYGEPLLVHFAEHNPDAAGYSLLQFIETSSITGHFVDKNGDCYLDIFSCKPYDRKVAIQVVLDYLNPESVKSQFLMRNAR